MQFVSSHSALNDILYNLNILFLKTTTVVITGVNPPPRGWHLEWHAAHPSSNATAQLPNF